MKVLNIIIPTCLSLFSMASAFQMAPSSHSTTKSSTTQLQMDRRGFVAAASTFVVSSWLPEVANAGIDPTLLKALPVEGDKDGTAQRLRQIEAVQRPASDLTNIPFEELPSGVSYREYREGKGEAGTFDFNYVGRSWYDDSSSILTHTVIVAIYDFSLQQSFKMVPK